MNMLKELRKVLKLEHEALLRGDFEVLEALLPRKETLSEWLATHKPDVPEYEYREVKNIAVQNEALMKSAQRGLQAALVQVRQVREGVEQTTYSSSGERRPLSQTPASITQRA